MIAAQPGDGGDRLHHRQAHLGIVPAGTYHQCPPELGSHRLEGYYILTARPPAHRHGGCAAVALASLFLVLGQHLAAAALQGQYHLGLSGSLDLGDGMGQLLFKRLQIKFLLDRLLGRGLRFFSSLRP